MMDTSPLMETETTEDQEDTELECSPFFQALETLPMEQIHHLRRTGLLSAASATEGLYNDEENNNNKNTTNKAIDYKKHVCLLYDKHAQYMKRALSLTTPLSSSFTSLDSSRPWMLYWTLHGCDLLGEVDNGMMDAAVLDGIITTLQACWSASVSKCSDSAAAGGFGGGPGQMAHCAPTYAAVSSLCILATLSSRRDDDNMDDDDDAIQNEDQGSYTTSPKSCTTEISLKTVSQRALQYLKEIRIPLQLWYFQLHEPSNGGYRMHIDGELDVRATYCIMACAKLLNLKELLKSSQIIMIHPTTPTAFDFCVACQTYEGGFGGEPGSEAHGGYTYCAVAALQLMGQLHDKNKNNITTTSNSNIAGTRCNVDIPLLTGWLVRRQMSFEGGFQGRCNKLVDGCYSFWQGAAIAIVSAISSTTTSATQESSAATPMTATTYVDNDPWLTAFQEKTKLRTSTNSSSSISQPQPSLFFTEGMLQRYILLCSQDVNGGLRDKPSKSRDFYHSCYCLSGLSISQHYSSGCGDDTTNAGVAYGDPMSSIVAQTHPLYNLRMERVAAILSLMKGEGMTE